MPNFVLSSQMEQFQQNRGDNGRTIDHRSKV